MKWSMCVCDTNTCLILQQRGRRLTVDAAEIEEHGAALVAQADVETRIAERRIDQAGNEGGSAWRQPGSSVTRIRRTTSRVHGGARRL